MLFKRISALALVVALTLVPAVGRAVQRLDLPNAKPRLSAPYRSVDVRPNPILIAPDTSALPFTIRPESGHARADYRIDDDATVPAAPDVSDRGKLRGPPSIDL
jgi:hypothetical protein